MAAYIYLAFKRTASKTLNLLPSTGVLFISLAKFVPGASKIKLQVSPENRNKDQAYPCPLNATGTQGRTASQDRVVYWERGSCDTHGGHYSHLIGW